MRKFFTSGLFFLIYSISLQPLFATSSFNIQNETKLFNEVPQIVIVHHDNKTTFGITNNFQRDSETFSNSIRFINSTLLNRLDDYSTPRLIEYQDGYPCDSTSPPKGPVLLPLRSELIQKRDFRTVLVYILTKNGRVEGTENKTVKLPTHIELPWYINDGTGNFYRAMLKEQMKKIGKNTLFVEYAGNMDRCEFCGRDLITREELKQLGVSWSEKPKDVFLTRLRLVLAGIDSSDDLSFVETKDQHPFKIQYTTDHPWEKGGRCEAVDGYRKEVLSRLEKPAENLATLTDWELQDIQKVIRAAIPRRKTWYRRILNKWGNDL